jgi:hypothetical protein
MFGENILPQMAFKGNFFVIVNKNIVAPLSPTQIKIKSHLSFFSPSFL